MAKNAWDAAAGVVGGLVGGIGANNAAKRQQAAANQAMRMQRQNMLMGLQLNEPARAIGYGAYGDIARQFGYSMPEYQSNNSLMATMNPLTTKQIKGMVKNGMGVDQIGQVGTYAGQLDAKSIKRLTKAGLSMDQIQQLSTRQAPQAGVAGGATQGAAPAPGTAFVDSPDYQWRLNEGQRNIGNSFAARGGAASGNALRALTDYNQGQASGEFQNWFNRRFQLSQRGDQANGNIQQGAQNYTTGYGQSQQQLGDARASGIMGVTNSIIGGLSNVAGAFGGMPGIGANKLPGFPAGTRYDTPGIYNIGGI
jgi:hypothetical protein